MELNKPAEPTRIAADLGARLGARGWEFGLRGDTITARRADWPAQLEVRLDLTTDEAVSLALTIDFTTMPLRGERFREIFNNQREELLEAMGTFTVRQLLEDGTWERDLPDRAFMHGVVGIRRQTRVAFFQRNLSASGDSLDDLMAVAVNRLAEAGNQVAGALQRVYQRTVLGASAAADMVPAVFGAGQSTPVAMEAVTGEYPWRR